MNQSSLKPCHNPSPLDHYTPMLKESIDSFLSQYRRGVTDFSNFSLIFSRLLQTLPDPPLEIVWFYSAVSFHTTQFIVKEEPLKKVSALRDLFQLLVSCSSSCHAAKRIALLAPVVLELYNLLLDERDGVLRREVEGLIEGIVSYISICTRMKPEEEKEEQYETLELSSCFKDLVRIWLVNRCGEHYQAGNDIKVFFPVATKKILAGIGERCRIDFLAGVVMSEVFLLGLCLKFGLGLSRADLEKILHDWAVQAINGLRSLYFLDALLRVLMEPVLPLTPLLTYDDQFFLQQVLFDAVISMQYSFFGPNSEVQLPDNSLKTLGIAFLFVADNAIQSARKCGNQTKELFYSDAFSQSGLPSLLVKWVNSQIGTGEKLGTPKLSTPSFLIKWLLLLDVQGIKSFDNNFKLHAVAVCNSREGNEFSPLIRPESKNLGDVLFLDSDQGKVENALDVDMEMIDSVDEADPDATWRTNLETNGRRKRKEDRHCIDEKQIKCVKYLYHEGVPLQ